eukprot:7181487-Pyramimonas_sp.AAC.1
MARLRGCARPLNRFRACTAHRSQKHLYLAALVPDIYPRELAARPRFTSRGDFPPQIASSIPLTHCGLLPHLGQSSWVGGVEAIVAL